MSVNGPFGAPSVAPSETCGQCGRLPARRFTFREVNGKIVWMTIRTVKGPHCRDCAQALGRHVQSRTLVLGWWGLFSFFVTAFVVIANTVGLVRARSMESPTTLAIGRALEPGPPLWGRRMGQIGLAVVVVLIGAITAATVLDDSASWDVGSCVRGDDRVEAVECSADHDGRIVAVVDDDADCPVTADAAVDRRSDTYCIDLDT